MALIGDRRGRKRKTRKERQTDVRRRSDCPKRDAIFVEDVGETKVGDQKVGFWIIGFKQQVFGLFCFVGIKSVRRGFREEERREKREERREKREERREKRIQRGFREEEEEEEKEEESNLEITVDETRGVEGSETLKELADAGRGLFLRVVVKRNNLLKQLSSRDAFRGRFEGEDHVGMF